METIKALWKNKKLTYLFMIVGTIVIVLYYGKKIPYIHTVWELADEYGYLANAAFMSGTDWSFMVDLYYGYGYSLLLIPLFFLFDTGIEMIRGAVFVNVICLILLFWVSYALMQRLFSEMNQNIIALAAFVMCFYPYFTGSGLKVLPECLMALMIWVCGFLFYQALSTGKRKYYLFLAAAVNYTFFVHTRTFVFLGILFFIGFIMCLQKKIDKKNLISFLSLAGVLFLFGTLWKNHLIEHVYRENVLLGVSEVTRNTVSISVIFEKIADLVKNFSMRNIDSFFAKIFYLFAASAGLIFLGGFQSIRESIRQLKKEKQLDAVNGIKLMYVLALFLMVIALVVNPMGETEGTAHYFYARYYEYLAGPVLFIGLCEAMRRRQDWKTWLAVAAVLVISAWFTMDLAGYLDVPELYMDTNRMPALSYFLNRTELFDGMVKEGIRFLVPVLGIFFLLNRFQWTRWSILILVFSIFMNSNKLNVNYVIGLNGKNKAHYAITECIRNHKDTREVYFLNEDVYAITIYTSMQALMGDKKITIIEKQDLDRIESGDVIVTFWGNPYIEELKQTKTKLAEIECYEVYAVE